MRWWAIIYWVVALSLFGVFVWRRIQSRSSPTSPASTVISTGPASGPTPQATIGDLGTPVTPVEKVWPAPPPPEPGDDTWRLESDASGAEPSRGESTVPAPVEPGTPGNTLPELLAGITLPHELVPLTQIDADIDFSTHVIVATQKAPADVVRGGLADELERLGYEIHHDSMLKLKAQGPRGTVRIEIHPDGAAVVDGGARRFPTAAEHSVVVELFAG